MINRERLIKTLYELVSANSISGTLKENVAVEKIVELIKEISYFKNNPENLEVIAIKQDPFKRGFVSALVKADNGNKDTIIITGHLDVVDIEDFGHLKDIAFDIDKITERIVELNPDEATMKDIKTLEWIFGRGVADMKYGIALCIELLRWFSEKDKIPGNILFLAVPGEESNSEGMLAAVPYIEKMQGEGYNFKACFVTECTVPRWIGDNTKRIYTGSIGKVMPLFFCRGKESHVCDALSSVNPNLIISEITRMIENNPDFCTPYKGESNPPPVCLKQTDLKDLYNVQTPLYATAYFNLLTLKYNAKEMLDKFKNIGELAFENSLNRLNEHSKRFGQMIGKNPIINKYEPKTLTYLELWDKVSKIKENLDDYMTLKIQKWQKEEMNNQTIAIKIIKELCDLYPDKNPLLVVGFAPPYYPARIMEGDSNKEKDLLKNIEDTMEFAKDKLGQELERCYFYDAISDLSYTGLNAQESENSIFENMPGLGKNYHLPIAELEKLNIPGVVFGGLGKDFHKNTERLNIPYSIDVVPKLYEFIINNIFKI